MEGTSPNRRIAARYQLADASLRRHAAAHLPQAAVVAQQAQEVTRGDGLLDQVRQRQVRVERLAGIAEGLIAKAAGESDWRGATAAVQASVSASREVRSCLELVAKLLGELDERPQINVFVSPEWVAMRTRVVMALGPYPEARQAVVAALADGA